MITPLLKSVFQKWSPGEGGGEQGTGAGARQKHSLPAPTGTDSCLFRGLLIKVIGGRGGRRERETSISIVNSARRLRE